MFVSDFRLFFLSSFNFHLNNNVNSCFVSHKLSIKRVDERDLLICFDLYVETWSILLMMMVTRDLKQ